MVTMEPRLRRSHSSAGDIWMQVIGREKVVDRQSWKSYRELYTPLLSEDDLPPFKTNLRKRSLWGFPRVFRPDHPFVFWWKVFSRVWDVLYTAFALPFAIAFQGVTPENSLNVLCLIASFIFFLDFLINLNTGFIVRYNVQKMVVMRRSAIISYYISTWHFIFDFLSVLPLPFQVVAVLGWEEWWLTPLTVMLMFQLLRLLKLWKVLLVVQIGGYTLMLYRHFSINVLHLYNLMYTAAVLLNGMACLWCWTAHYVGVHNSWLTTVGGEDLSEAGTGDQYIAALYFAMTTMTTTGYGDIVSHTSTERGIALMIMVAGACFFTFIISSFTTLLGQANDSAKSMRELRSKLEGVESWMSRSKLPPHLQHNIKEYYVQAWNPDLEDMYNVAYINQLPASLKEDVAEYLTSDMIEASPMFGVLGKDERRFLATHLKARLLPEGHDLFKQGEKAGSLFMLAEGELECVRYTEILEQVESPAFVGEMVLLMDTIPQARYREVTCRAVQPSIVWELAVEDLKHTVVVYPHLYPQLQQALHHEISSTLQRMRQHDPQWFSDAEIMDDSAIMSAMAAAFTTPDDRPSTTTPTQQSHYIPPSAPPAGPSLPPCTDADAPSQSPPPVLRPPTGWKRTQSPFPKDRGGWNEVFSALGGSPGNGSIPDTPISSRQFQSAASNRSGTSGTVDVEQSSSSSLLIGGGKRRGHGLGLSRSGRLWATAYAAVVAQNQALMESPGGSPTGSTQMAAAPKDSSEK